MSPNLNMNELKGRALKGRALLFTSCPKPSPRWIFVALVVVPARFIGCDMLVAIPMAARFWSLCSF